MAWLNTVDNSVSFGDKPYGSFWQAIPDAPDSLSKWDINQNAWVPDANKVANVTLDNQNVTDLAAITVDNQIQNFIKMTPAQVDAYFIANVTTAAQAIPILKILCKAVLILTRRQLLR